MNRYTLLELAERCEKADGPDRDIDWAICGLLNTGRSTDPRRPGPDYFTASIDAAMTLIPESWTAWEMASSDRRTQFWFEVTRMAGDGSLMEHLAEGLSPFPALAICAAALRAVAGEGSA
jgi:hypothetical protein